jgi:hypothetical protein
LSVPDLPRAFPKGDRAEYQEKGIKKIKRKTIQTFFSLLTEEKKK